MSGKMKGIIRVEIVSADLGGLLDRLMQEKVELYDVSMSDELKALATVARRDCGTLLQICEKCGASCKIISRKGLYRYGIRLMRRPVLAAGLLVLILMTLWLPGRILFIQVEGNRLIPDREILAAAEQCGIAFGASRRQVRSEELKNALLEAMPQLQWAGVNTRGCVAVISVRERSDTAQKVNVPEYGNVVAVRDGVIVSCTATRGRLLCSPGQAVIQGQILISGYTDSGLTIRAECAEGEVYARTLRALSAVFPLMRDERAEQGNELKKIGLIIGKFRINLWKDSGISDTTCDRMYEEYYVTLPGGFRLPVAVVLERYRSWRVEEVRLEQEAGEAVLHQFGVDYLRNQMTGGQVLSRDVRIREDRDILALEGSYTCLEMIGKLKQEEIGVYNGENN